MRARRLATSTIVLAGLACSSPEKQIEANRRYESVTYNDTTLESFSRTDRTVTGVLVSGPGDSVRFRIRAAKDDLVAGVDITLHSATSRDEPRRAAAHDARRDAEGDTAAAGHFGGVSRAAVAPRPRRGRG